MATDSDDTTNPLSVAKRVITLDGNRVDTRDIFNGTSEVIILHGKDRYRLRLTPQNELILTSLAHATAS